MAYIDWNIKKKIHIPIIFFIFLGLLTVSYVSFVSIESITKNVYAQSEKSLKNIFFEKFQAKKDVAIASVIPISSNSVIKKALLENNRTLAIKELNSLSQIYKKYTKFKNIKIHIHTKDYILF
jgi:methyl-accepting chemotaxis protein